MTGSLEERVREWLATEGYALEYRAFHAFRDAGGMQAAISLYSESAEGQNREIDVTAWHKPKREADLVEVVCECKYSPDERPWVLMVSRTEELSDSDFWRATPMGFFADLPENLPECFHFDHSRTVSHTMLQALRKTQGGKRDRDTAFEALQKIANAAWDRSSSRHGGAALPCIVVDGGLIEARYDVGRGDFVTREVPMGRLAWEGCGIGTTLIDVVHVSELERYAKLVSESAKALADVFATIDGVRRMCR